jgi:hypothetical protein
MKKIIAFIIIILPLVAMAQKGNSTVDDFFKKYSEDPSYSSMEVTEDMFKMFGDMESEDSELSQFLSKLKFVKFMEFNKGGIYVSTGNYVNSNKQYQAASTYNYYVDGKRVNSKGIGKSKGKAYTKAGKTNTTKSTGVVVSTGGTNNYTTGAANPTSYTKSYGKASNTYQVHKMSEFYKLAIDEIDIEEYTQLMKSNQDGEKMIFLKRKFSANDQEFLLINGNTLINIRGDINVKHLYELEEILEVVGDILPL